MVAAVAVAAGVLVVHAQQTMPFRAGVNFVRVDAIVADKTGAFIPDLTQSDFEISELGHPQTVETFQRIVLDGGLMAPAEDLHPINSDDDERREAARDDVRLFGMFLDDYHVTREMSLQTRETIARFVANDLGPSDMIALMTPITPLASVVMTRNRDSIEHQIEQFLGRKGEYDPPKNIPEENVLRQYGGQPAMIEQVRNQVAFTALEGLITHLGSYKDGRKTLVLVSEGLGLRELDLQELYTEANRRNVSVYWIDPRRLNALGGPSLRSAILREDPLKALTLYTDGRAIINGNDLATAMKNIVRDMSGYYLLGYNSTLDATDGKYHEISVRVKRSGVTVRARKGYWAYTKTEVGAATAPPRPAAAPDVRAALNALAAAERGEVSGDAIVLRAASAPALRQLQASANAPGVTARVFSRVEHVAVRVPAGGRDAPVVQAALLNAAGDRLLTVPAAAHDAYIDCVLPLASLAAGEYLLEVSDEARSVARSLIAFRVRN